MNCESPVRIKDKKTGKYMLVPCGKCRVCRYNKQQEWKRRLEVEASQHFRTFFVTLTYSNSTVPVFRPVDDIDTFPMTAKRREDLKEFLSLEADLKDKYLVLKYEDIQKFLKRLRWYISNDKHIPSWQRNIRFYCCGEYGETTQRPHYHLLVFVDNEYLCTPKQYVRKDGVVIQRRCPLEIYLRKAWSIESTYQGAKFRKPIGHVVCEVARGKAANYCAGYVTTTSDIPPILRQGAFKPFNVSSRFPAIGALQVDKEQLEDLVVNGRTEIFNKCGCESDGNVNVPLWPSIQNKVFPKIRNYSSLSNSDRFVLYGSARFPYQGSSFTEFLDYLDGCRWHDVLCRCFELEEWIRPVPDTPLYRSVYRLWSQSRHVLTYCSLINQPLSSYVGCIDNYYSSLQYDGLLKQLDFEANFALQNDSRYLLSYVDPLVFENLRGEDYELTLSSFGYGPLDDPVFYSFWDNPEYTVPRNRIINFVERGKSYKRKSDYKLHGDLNNVDF